MHRVQRNHVARMLIEQRGEARLRALVVVAEHGIDRREVEPLARVRRQRRGARDDRARRSEAARVAAADQLVRLQHVCHHEPGRFVERAHERRGTIAAPGQRARERLLVGVARRRRRP